MSALVGFITQTVLAQQITVNQATTQNQVQQLVENVLLGSCVTVSNVTYTGPANASGTFNSNGSTFPMQSGILLTTGSANTAIGPNNDNNAGVDQGRSGDANLTTLSGVTTYDGVILEFDFVPEDDTLNFDYIFASEEYPEWVGSQYNDVFGFFISGPGISGPYIGNAANIALIPGTTTPVAINNVNNGNNENGPCENCAYYNQNGGGSAVQYDGYTTTLTAQVVVQTCQTYHIRLAIADAGDRIYDSGVFLKEGSFSAGGGITVGFSGVSISEGCSNQYIIFSRVNLANNSSPIGATYTIGGTAAEGVDYDAFPTSVTIPAGQDTVMVPISVFLDNLTEPVETIIVNMDQPPCDCLAPGSATINVLDNQVRLAVTTTGQTTICLGQSANLTASTSGSIAPYSGSWNSGTPAGANVTVAPTTTTTYTYTVTDACAGQTETSSETFTVIRPDFTTNDVSQCLDGNSFVFTNTGATGGTVSHYWTFGDGTTSTNENPTHTYGSAGTFTATHYVIFTASACTTNASATITVYPEPIITASVDAEVICAGGTEGAISTSVSGGTAGYGYAWTPGGMSTANISSLGVGNYSVVVTDANGCTDNTSATVGQNDPVPPTVTCPPTANITTDAGICTSSASIGAPATSDNCGVQSTTVDNLGPYPVGNTTVTWTVTDVNGNTNTCTQLVVVTDGENPTITCPAIANITTDAGVCTSSASIGAPATSDNCGVQSTTVDNLGPYPVGNTTVTWTVTDVNGNTNTCTQLVVVTDGENPTISGCPVGILVTPASSDCTPVVTWTIPQANDNCSASLSSTHNSGDSFPVGTTTVTYTATDLAGNTFDCSFDVIITPSVLVLTITPSTVVCAANISCNGATDGTATANVSGGCLPYSFDWSDGQSTQTATGLGAGTYTVIVTDANGSTQTESVTLSQPDELVIDGFEVSEYIGGEGVSCNGATDGEIDITVIGGATCQAYTFSWTGPNGFTSSSQNLTGLEAGSYTVTIEDINGCSTTGTYTISEPDALIPSCTSEGALCNADANGTVEVSVAGGTTPYTYAWSNSVDSISASQTGLTAGTYGVTVTDANGCVITCSSVVGEPDVLNAVVTAFDETLVNGCNGSAIATPIGGTPPYTYEWSDSQTDSTAIDLCAAIYSVTVTDANGCEFTTSVVINPPTCDLDVDVTGTDVSCNTGTDGTATATPITQQNNTPFTYEWNNGDTTQTISGVTAGPYSVVVTDSIGCEASGSVVVSEPTALTVGTSVIDEQTFGGCDGSATANPTGGTPPYTYEWDDADIQTTQTAEDLCPGMYSVTVTDANGCEETVTITVNPLLCTGFSVAVNTERLSCFEAGDGSATAVVTGGIAPFTYSWDNGGSASSISALAADTYTVIVTDAVNCSQTVSGNVIQPALLEAATAVDNVSCNGVANGVVELTVTGGTTPYDFDWDNGATTEDLEDLGPGAYNVLVTDENGCTTTASAEVTELDTLQASSVDVNPTCFEGNDGSIDLTISGGLGPYLVAWDNGANTEDISDLSAGTYVATIVDQNGCIYTYSTTLTEPILVVPTVTASGSTIFCEGDSVTLTASESAGYSWSPNGETTQSIIVYDAGDYTVSAVTEDGCEGTSASTTVTMFQVDQAIITADGLLEFCAGERVQLTASEGDSYEWSTGETSQSIFVNSGGTYYVTVTDENGCESTSADVVVVVNPLPQVDVTANGPTEFCEGGSVTLTATESDSYFWTPNGETTQSITVTESGNYGVGVTDENGCANESQLITVTIYATETAVISASGSLKFCDGEDVTLTASTGDSYTWFPNGETDQSIVVSDSGQYVVTVIDANGCSTTSDTANVIVIQNPEPVIVADGLTEFCQDETVILSSSIHGGNVWSPNAEETDSITVGESGNYFVTTTDKDGCVGESNVITVTVFDTPTPTITASGVTEICQNDSVILTSSSADSYLWSPNGETSQSITVYQSGIYSVTVVDANGCEGSALTAVEITVFETEPAAIYASGSLEFCDGDGVILTSSLGDSYNWSPNGEVTPSITITQSGEYVVAVTDANGCEAISDTVEVTVFELPEPVISLSGATIFCEGDSLTLTASLSDAYLWYPDGQTTQSITVYEEGSFAVQLGDANTCVGTSDTIDVTVHEATEIEITADGTTDFCDGGEVILTATGGQSYEWIPNGEQTPAITVSESGQYMVTAIDFNGCSYDSDTTEVVVFDLPTVNIDVTGNLIFCEGETADLTATSPNVVTYEWLGNGLVINGADTEFLTVGDSSLYTVIVTDVNGCTATEDAPIITIEAVPVVVISEDQWICVKGDVTLTASGGDNYLWSNGSTDASITVSPDSAAYYTVTVSNELCSFTSSDSALVSVYLSPIAEIETNANGFLEVNHDFTDVSGDSSIVYWEWNFGDGDFEEIQNPDHLYSDEGFFTVVLSVENEFGCLNTDTAEVEITQVIDIPNVFTPNNDGINDFIFIDNFGVEEYEFTVYNRWGIVMHYDASTEISWNGRTPAGAKCEAGTYYYTLNVLNIHSEGNFKQNGTITLIR